MLKAYARLQARLNSVRSEEEGASAVEYALIVGLISIVVVVALTGLFGGFQGWIEGLDTPWTE
jgi:pilus assembly protein Flp/PilA